MKKDRKRSHMDAAVHMTRKIVIILLALQPFSCLAASCDEDLLLVNAWTACASNFASKVVDSAAMNELYSHAEPTNQFNGRLKKLFEGLDHPLDLDHEYAWPDGDRNDGDFQATIQNFTDVKNNQRITISALQRACFVPNTGNIARSTYKATIVNSWPRLIDSSGQESIMLPYAKSWVETSNETNANFVYYTMAAHCWEGKSKVGATLNARVAEDAHESDVELKQLWHSQAKRMSVDFKESVLLVNYEEWYNIWEMSGNAMGHGITGSHDPTLTPDEEKPTLRGNCHKLTETLMDVLIRTRTSVLIQSISSAFAERISAFEALYDPTCAKQYFFEDPSCMSLATRNGLREDQGDLRNALFLVQRTLENWQRWQQKEDLLLPDIFPAFLSTAYDGCNKYELFGQGYCDLFDPRRNKSAMAAYQEPFADRTAVQRFYLWQDVLRSVEKRNKQYDAFYAEMDRIKGRIKSEFEGQLTNVINDWASPLPFGDCYDRDSRNEASGFKLPGDPIQAESEYNQAKVKFFDWRLGVVDPWDTREILTLRDQAFADIQMMLQLQLEEEKFANAPCTEITTRTEMWLLFFAVVAAGIGGMEGYARTLDKSYVATRKRLRHLLSWRQGAANPQQNDDVRNEESTTSAKVFDSLWVLFLTIFLWLLIVGPIIALGVQVGRDKRVRLHYEDSERVVVTLPRLRFGPSHPQYGHQNALSTVILVTSKCSRNNFDLGVGLLVSSVLMTAILNAKFMVFTFKLVCVGLFQFSFHCKTVLLGLKQFSAWFQHDSIRNTNPVLIYGFVRDPEQWNIQNCSQGRTDIRPGLRHDDLSESKLELLWNWLHEND